MYRRRPYFALLCLLLLVAQAAAKSLEDRIEKILQEEDVARSFWGIQVVSLSTGKVLYAQNADKLFTPASTTKLFTTAATLAMIGPEYRFRTTVETTGVVDKYGRLNGDLLLVGRGDPNLSGRVMPFNTRTERRTPHLQVLENLADELVRKGVKYIDGDVVADDSYFAFERYGEGWAREDLISQWGAPVSALSINDNLLFVSILPADRPGEKAFVSITPYADYFHVDNRVITTPQGTGPSRVFINREPGSNLLTLWGNIPVDDAGASQAMAIEDPAEFAAQLFRNLLERRGVVVYGRQRAKHTELASLSTFSVTTRAPAGGGAVSADIPAQPQAMVLATHQSMPLIEGLRVINKISQNLHAELMLRLLGRERGMSGTVEAGLEVLRGFLMQAGVAPEEYVFYDGSGLSRQNLVTPRAVVRLLQYAKSQPWATEFRGTLPLAGNDGTLANRFKGSPAEGRVWAKTGILSHVEALAGYAITGKGEEVAFVILANNHNLPRKRTLQAIDSIVEQIVGEIEKE
jgi:D-alanyl-D-alanine carboxypeptidase/D-alanyl-D-alanine-endopeptidase (penicillin-binding protein 4)